MTADEHARTAQRILRTAQGSDPATVAIAYALLALYEQREAEKNDPIGRIRTSDSDAADAHVHADYARPVGLDIKQRP